MPAFRKEKKVMQIVNGRCQQLRRVVTMGGATTSFIFGRGDELDEILFFCM